MPAPLLQKISNSANPLTPLSSPSSGP
jgi:hypothetical protein